MKTLLGLTTKIQNIQNGQFYKIDAGAKDGSTIKDFFVLVLGEYRGQKGSDNIRATDLALKLHNFVGESIDIEDVDAKIITEALDQVKFPAPLYTALFRFICEKIVTEDKKEEPPVAPTPSA